MTPQEYTQLLKNPQLASKMTYEELEQLLLDYPYCQSLRLILLNKYQQDEHIAYERHLQLAALSLPDRKHLKFFLEQNKHAKTLTNIVPINNTEMKTRSASKVDQANAGRISDSPPAVHITIEETKSEEEMGDKNTDDSKKKRFKLPRIPILEDKSVLDAFQTSEKKAENNTNKITTPKTTNVDDLADLDFSIKRDKKADKTINLELEKLAEQSVAENEEIISETLAGLLAQQGKKDKALKMYKALSLKFPEKNRFFAQKIAELDQNNNG